MVWKLIKAINGTRQAGRLFTKKVQIAARGCMIARGQ
jgi:hypothetical protein